MATPTPLRAQLGSGVALLATCAVMTLAAAMQPSWNFDCVMYAGATRALLGESVEARHRTVYDELRTVAPADAQKSISAGSRYRKMLAREARTFSDQLPLYANKPGYVAAIALCAKLGANSVRAAFAISAVAYGVLAALIALAMRQLAGGVAGFILAACLVLTPALREAGVLATPDALCAAPAFAAMWILVFARGREWLASALLALSVAIRPDAVLFGAAVLAWHGVTLPARRTHAVMGIAGCASVWLACSLAAPGYSWNALIAHTFVERITAPADFTSAAVTPFQYLDIVQRGVRGNPQLPPSLWPVFGLLSALSWAGAPAAGAEARDQLRLQALIWLAVLAHFLAFPMLSDRFFIAHYATLAVSAVAIFTRVNRRA